MSSSRSASAPGSRPPLSGRWVVLLNLLILVVHFALIAAHTQTEERFLRAAVRAHALPASRPLVRRVPLERSPGESRQLVADPGASASYAHARLANFLSHVEPPPQLSGEQRRAVFRALSECGGAFQRAAVRWRDQNEVPRSVRSSVREAVEDRLRSAAIRDEATLAQLVRIVMASAG